MLRNYYQKTFNKSLEKSKRGVLLHPHWSRRSIGFIERQDLEKCFKNIKKKFAHKEIRFYLCRPVGEWDVLKKKKIKFYKK